MGTVLAATAVLALVFGLAQLLVPGPVLAIFGVKLDANAELFARAQGAAYLGYAAFNWMARGSDLRAQRAALVADLFVAVAGAAISLYAISLGNGSALMWIWVIAFVAFAAWQAYALTRSPR